MEFNIVRKRTISREMTTVSEHTSPAVDIYPKKERIGLNSLQSGRPLCNPSF